MPSPAPPTEIPNCPTAMAWLWRDYDPMLTHQTYVTDPAGKDKPYLPGQDLQSLTPGLSRSSRSELGNLQLL